MSVLVVVVELSGGVERGLEGSTKVSISLPKPQCRIVAA